ncbi:hypothetical protein ADE_53900 [Achromobacter denitrificans]|nr:hypothetical protein ADE_53900 [Achromobacter denitrificans]
MPLRFPPQSAYVAPGSKNGRDTQRRELGLTYCPVSPFALLLVRIKDLTADIFHVWNRWSGPDARLPPEGGRGRWAIRT